MTIHDRALLFRSLRYGGQVLALPNAWDVVSARVIEDAGAAAIATTSSGAAWSLGAAYSTQLFAATRIRGKNLCDGYAACVTARTALVTGAGRGIGRAVAVKLAAAGHRVALTARSAGELEETAAFCLGPTLVVPADLTAPGAVDDVFAEVESDLGAVEILVANAGAATSAPLHRINDADWQWMLDLNLTAPFRCIRRAVPAMTATGYGRIVVLASVASKRGEPYIAAYTAAKHGVLGLVRSAAAELARTGVTVNAVCPAYVDTPMTDRSVATIVEKTGRPAEEARRTLADRQPIGRLITVDEVAEAVWFCVQNPGVTGQGINVDGGAIQS